MKSITRDAMDPDPSLRRLTLFSYDDQGNLRYFDPPLGVMGRVQFEYVRYTLDANNNPVLDGRYQGEVTHVTYPDGRSEYFGYNDAGELAWERKGSGAVITISGRDGQHRVTRIDYPDEGASFGFAATTTYDEFGRPVASTDRQGTTQRFFDLLDRPTQVLPPSPQAALTFSYTADTTLQRWITTVTAAGVGSYVYKEDTKGRLSDLVNPFSQTFHQEYDLDGKTTLTQFPSGIQEARTYTPRDWLASMQVKDALGTPLKTLEDFYTDAQSRYDPTGHLQREVENGSATHSFFYNPHYELTGETLPNATSIQYGLDANGNRTSVTTNGVTDYYRVDAADKLLWVNQGTNAPPTSGQSNPYTLFGYDTDGRTSVRDRRDKSGLQRTVNLFWDSDDRLQQITSGADTLLSATYNGDGERVSKTDFWTGTHNYSWGAGGILADSNAGTVYTPGFGQRQSGTDRFFHTDWLGSTRYLSDSGGSFPDTLAFDAFGNRTSASTAPYPTEFQFGATSGYESEYASTTDPGVGLQLLGERYYDPAVGRFISPDPIGFAGGLNLYAYCDHDPVNCTDGSGLAADEEPWEPRDPNENEWIDPDIARFLNLWREAQERRFQEILRANGITPEGFRAGLTAEVGRFLAGSYRQDLQLLPCDQIDSGLLPDPALLGGDPALSEENGVGAYNRVGGHHIHSKAAFDQDPNYSKGKALSISPGFMEDNELEHDLMSAQQRKGFRELEASGRPNTMEEHNRLAVEALMAGGMKDEARARSLVEKSVEVLNRLGVKGPSRIPRFGR